MITIYKKKHMKKTFIGIYVLTILFTCASMIAVAADGSSSRYSGKSGVEVKMGTLQPHLFYFYPNQDHQLSWTILSGELRPGNLDYTIIDMYAREVSTGVATTDDSVTVTATVNLPQGYYLIQFPGLQARFGLAVLPYLNPDNEPDRFFSIHADLNHDDRLTWLSAENHMTRHENLFKTLHNIGIRRVRDRLVMNKFAPRPDQWSWEGDNYRYDEARLLYDQYDIDFTANNAVTPNWMRSPEDQISGSNLEENKFPSDLHAYTDAYLKIYGRWKNEMGVIEIWNEPSGMTYDRLGSLINAMAYAFKSKGHDVTIATAAFAGLKEKYVKKLGDMGCWDAVDMVTFHTYANPLQTEERTRFYKDIAGMPEHPYLPISLTETGQKYVGGVWPDLDQEYLRAEMIGGNAAEAKAAGNEGFYPFVFKAAPFNTADNATQHSLVDIYGTPFLSMAAYANAVIQLSHKRYLGDLTINKPQVLRARVFGDGDTAVAVLYNDQETAITLNAPAIDVFGIDGRRIDHAVNEDIFLEDRVMYVVFEQADLQEMIDTNTSAMELYQRNQKAAQLAKRKIKPVVLQHMPDYDHFEYHASAYHLNSIFEGNVPMYFQASNLSDQDQTITVSVETPGFLSTLNDTFKTVNVPANSTANIAWYIRLEEEQPGFKGEVMLKGVSGSDSIVAPVKFEVIVPREVPQVLESFASYRKIDISNSSKWSTWGQQGYDLNLEIEGDTVTFGLEVTDNKTGTQAFYNIPGYDLTKAKGLLVVAREDKRPPNISRYWPKIKFGVEETGGAKCYGSEIPDDGQVHWSYVEFQELPVNVLDDNQTLDLDQIQRFVVHTWHGIPDVTVHFEVYDLYIVSDSMLLDDTEFDVTMVVKDKNTGELLENAKVTFDGKEFVTDTSGKIDLQNIEYGFYHQKIELENYYTIEKTQFELWKDTTLVFNLQRDLPDVTLRFINASDGEPIYRAIVNMSENTYLTNNDGEITIKNLKQDTIIISAEHSNYYILIDSFNIEKDSLFTIPLFPKMARVVFTVSDSARQIKDAIVSLGTRSGTTNNEGIVAFYEQPTRETYIYEVLKEGYPTINDSFYFTVDTNIVIDLGMATNSQWISALQEIVLYPNPCNKELVIDWHQNNGSVSIMNIYGNVIRNKELTTGLNRLKVDNLKPGVYMVCIFDHNQAFHKIVIKQEKIY